MSAIHLDMMELETDRQLCFEQTFAILAPHNHWVTEFVKRLMKSFIDFKATNTPFNVASFVKDVRAGF